MGKDTGTVTILDVTFKRTCPPNSNATHITYTMGKGTPFGWLTAAITVDYASFVKEGAATMDGKIYTELSAKLNLEEANRLLEGGANTMFGEEVA